MTKREIVDAMKRYSGAEKVYIIDGSELLEVGAVVRVEGKLALDVSAGELPLESKTLRAFPKLLDASLFALSVLKANAMELSERMAIEKLEDAIDSAGVRVVQ